MPSRLAAPVLTVDAGKMHKVDPRNVESLFGMWTVFSKCADSIEGGKRLENLSWRLWNRETLCCEAQPQYSITPAMDVSRQRPSQKEVPALSSSVDSADSDEPSEQVSCSGQSPLSDDSALSRSRGKEKHLTSLELEKMVFNIKKQTELEPLSPSVAANCPIIAGETHNPSSPSPQIEPMHPEPSASLHNSSDSCYSAATGQSSRHGDHRDSDTSVSSGSIIKSGSIVHGFSPSLFSSSYRARMSPDSTTPIPNDSPSKPEVCKKKAGGMFTLGGSSGDDESSFEERMCKQPKLSSLSDRLKHPEAVSRPSSFRAALQSGQIRTIKEGQDEDEGAIESDDEEMDESAIEEEEDSDWEDSVTESGLSSVPEEKPVFKRVDSRANLVSRKSLLTRGLHEPQRAAAMAEAAMKSSAALRRSRTSSPHGPSVLASPTTTAESGNAGLGIDVIRSKPIICNTHLPAHSPRTTRRNMLATELTESLRRHLLWERQQKSTTANAVYKRRHTAHNEMANLQEFPGPKVVQPLKEVSKNNSWNHYFDYGPWEYHNKGW
ncbi:hypothetical protein GJ744_004726 [Endocarpon pusillum]|uniref:Nitrogen regulatory protein areA GATA-like domain-containing protein n=1 Tax=Endocarpon pusillum TaxID=364733 RepID=A0A8H7DXI9_9EURO|nr:hypothetical protein GJ744_004726 [Endocarpon pusillum]